ncbi:hypothetical protein ABPG74_011082 [Tetrahymena malaccensis]
MKFIKTKTLNFFLTQQNQINKQLSNYYDQYKKINIYLKQQQLIKLSPQAEIRQQLRKYASYLIIYKQPINQLIINILYYIDLIEQFTFIQIKEYEQQILQIDIQIIYSAEIINKMNIYFQV